MNVPPKGSVEWNLGAYFATLKVSQQPVPNLTVRVSEGSYWIGGTTLVEFVGGNSPAVVPPGAGLAVWVLVCLNSSASINLIYGTPAVSNPVPPAVPAGRLPLAYMYIVNGTTAITLDMIFDERPLWTVQSSFVPLSGGTMTGPLVLNGNPLTALGAATKQYVDTSLTNYPTVVDLNNGLATKADVAGTPSETFLMNEDWVGAPSSNIMFGVKRGTLSDTFIRWNEGLDLWDLTNDGSTYAPILTGASGLSSLNDVLFGALTIGDVLTWNGANWTNLPNGSGVGTVTSVALTAPTEFSVTGSPVTTAGTLTITKAPQSANTVWAGPATGAAAVPTFRALVAADLPSTAVTAASYGSATQVGTFTDVGTHLVHNVVDPVAAQDAATKNYVDVADNAKVNKTDTLALTGDVTVPASALTGPANSFAATLANVGTAGTYDRVTTDAKGRVTSGVNQFLKASQAFTFGAIAANDVGDSTNTVTVTGAQGGDVVSIGMPASMPAGFTYMAWVSATDTVTVRAHGSASSGTGAGAANATISVVVTRVANV